MAPSLEPPPPLERRPRGRDVVLAKRNESGCLEMMRKKTVVGFGITGGHLPFFFVRACDMIPSPWASKQSVLIRQINQSIDRSMFVWGETCAPFFFFLARAGLFSNPVCLRVLASF